MSADDNSFIRKSKWPHVLSLLIDSDQRERQIKINFYQKINFKKESVLIPFFIFLQVYRIRWFILAVFSLLCGLQFMVWNAFGPITAAMAFAFNWTLGDISWMTMWGTITFILFVFPFIWLLEKYGLRFVVILMASLILAGAAFRMVKVQGTAFLWLSHV